MVYLIKVEPLYLGLKSREFRGRDCRREPETEPGAISDEKNVVDSSPAVRSHRKIDFCRLK